MPAQHLATLEETSEKSANRMNSRWLITSAVMCSLMSASALANSLDQARRIYDRLAGVPPTTAVLNTMASDISSSNATAAAMLAMDSPAFYNVTLKNFVMPWTNEAQTVFAPLNDYVATVIGVVKDNIDFREILYGNTYQGNILYTSGLSGLTTYSMTDNKHYEDLEARLSIQDVGGINLRDDLTRTTQTAHMDIPTNATAGVLTTRAAARAFFPDGTNRAMFRFTMKNLLCNDLEQIKDVTRAPDRIRQDVSRSPGGDSRIFLNACIGCHAGMDPMTQAFAYYDYEYTGDIEAGTETGKLVYNAPGMTDPITGTRVKKKYLINASNFRYGFVTTNDDWQNYWREGSNAKLGCSDEPNNSSCTGWSSSLTGKGTGAQSLAEELANSEAFASCQVKKVFRTVCEHDANSTSDLTKIESMTASFKSNYNLKDVFATAAVYCMGN